MDVWRDRLGRFGEEFWDFVSDWTLAGVLGVLGFGLSVYLLLRQRPAVVIEMHDARQLVEGVWQPWGVTFTLVNVGTTPAAISSVGVRQKGHEAFAQLPTETQRVALPSGATLSVNNPDFPLRLDAGQVLKWTVAHSWFRSSSRDNSEAVVRMYAPRAFWRRKKKRIRTVVGGSITKDMFEPIPQQTPETDDDTNEIWHGVAPPPSQPDAAADAAER